MTESIVEAPYFRGLSLFLAVVRAGINAVNCVKISAKNIV